MNEIYIHGIANERERERARRELNIASQLMVILECIYKYIYIYDPIDPPYVSIHTHTVICMHYYHHFAIKKKVDSPKNTVEFI